MSNSNKNSPGDNHMILLPFWQHPGRSQPTQLLQYSDPVMWLNLLFKNHSWCSHLMYTVVILFCRPYHICKSYFTCICSTMDRSCSDSFAWRSNHAEVSFFFIIARAISMKGAPWTFLLGIARVKGKNGDFSLIWYSGKWPRTTLAQCGENASEITAAIIIRLFCQCDSQWSAVRDQTRVRVKTGRKPNPNEVGWIMSGGKVGNLAEIRANKRMGQWVNISLAPWKLVDPNY